MLALQQSLPVPLDQHRLPVTFDRAAPARMLPLPASCGLQNHIKASTHNAFKFGTALQKLALTYLLQYAEYARKYARKYAEYDKKYAEYDKKYQNMTRNMQNNMQNMTKNMFKYAQYVIWYIVTRGLIQHSASRVLSESDSPKKNHRASWQTQRS